MVQGPFRAFAALTSLAILLGHAGTAPAQALDRFVHGPNPYAVESDGRYGPPPLPSGIIPGTLGYPYQRHYGGMHPSIWGEENPLPLPPARLLKKVPLGPGDLVYVATAVPIEVVLPEATAKLTFDGQPVRQEGTHREFITPPLVPGVVHCYEVRAVWTDNGTEVVRSRSIEVKAGDRVTVTFKKPR